MVPFVLSVHRITHKGNVMTIVCLGDSLTYGYEVSRRQVWTDLAKRETGVPIDNRGVNGLMTAGMLALCNRDVLARETRAVYIMGGANDILSGMDIAEPERGMAALVDKIRAAGILPVVGIPIPFCPPIREDWAALADFPERTPVYEQYVARLRNLTTDLDCPVVDFRVALADHARSAGLTPRSLYLDGIHLNEDGHRVFAAAFVRNLRDLTLI